MLRKLLLNRVGVPVAERLRGWPVSRYLRELLEAQNWPPQRIRATQDARLAALVQHAYETVPFYKRLFDSRGLTPDDVRTADDLPKLPILTKQDMRDNLQDLVSTAYDASRLAVLSSSGSTGEPFRYYMSEDERARKWAALYRLWRWAGYEMGDRFVNVAVAPHRAFRSNKLWMCLESRLSGMLALSASELYEHTAEEYLRRVVRFRPTMVRGYASSLYYLAEVQAQRGLYMRAKCVCTTGETLFDFQRELIEDAYGCRVYDGYGGEGMVIAGQCGHGDGYHTSGDILIVEIVDSQGNRCPPGVEGQVVLTDLMRYSMPFIRYNIQDVAALSDEVCSCGMGLPVLTKLSGRLTDIGVTPSGKSIVVHFFTGMFMKMAPDVDGFQVVQERPDLFILNIVPGRDFGKVKQEILDKTREYVGPDVEVQINLTDSIPLTSAGKRRLFISKCGVKAAGGLG